MVEDEGVLSPAVTEHEIADAVNAFMLVKMSVSQILPIKLVSSV